MKLVKAFLMSVGMFSVFPVTKNSWDQSVMPLVIPNMPVVGALIGLGWYYTAVVITGLNVSLLLKCAFIMAIPFILSGFLHIDGYMDTADAIFSRRDLEEKRRILKDSNVGAFGVIAFATLFMFQFCAVHGILFDEKTFFPLIFLPVVSRCWAGAALINLKSISKTGFGASFKASTGWAHTAALLFFMTLSFGSVFYISGLKGFITLAAASIAACMSTVYVYRQMDGISGDLCGFIITISELAGLLCLGLI